MNPDYITIDSPIEKKIKWAKDCYVTLKDNLMEHEEVRALLVKFKKAAHESHMEMKSSGIEHECRKCEEKEGGSCCGAGLENRYTGTLLLINLMLGQTLPSERNDPNSCYFLGEKGCVLLARHVICVNYLCKKLTDRIDAENISLLREKEGIELEVLFTLNEKVKTLLSKI